VKRSAAVSHQLAAKTKRYENQAVTSSAGYARNVLFSLVWLMAES
jgi:hypothetical protein